MLAPLGQPARRIVVRIGCEPYSACWHPARRNNRATASVIVRRWPVRRWGTRTCS